MSDLQADIEAVENYYVLPGLEQAKEHVLVAARKYADLDTDWRGPDIERAYQAYIDTDNLVTGPGEVVIKYALAKAMIAALSVTEDTNVGLGGEHMDYGPQEDPDAD